MTLPTLTFNDLASSQSKSYCHASSSVLKIACLLGPFSSDYIHSTPGSDFFFYKKKTNIYLAISHRPCSSSPGGQLLLWSCLVSLTDNLTMFGYGWVLNPHARAGIIIDGIADCGVRGIGAALPLLSHTFFSSRFKRREFSQDTTDAFRAFQRPLHTPSRVSVPDGDHRPQKHLLSYWMLLRSGRAALTAA